MGLRDILKKKDRIEEDGEQDPDTVSRLAAPEFTFIRSDTYTQEVIHPPSDPASANAEDDDSNNYLTAKDNNSSRTRKSLDVFKSRSRGSSVSSKTSTQTEKRESTHRRLSQRLHLSRAPASSENVPQNLPEIVAPVEGQEEDKDGTESQWEKRATMLAQTAGEKEPLQRSRPSSPIRSISGDFAQMQVEDRSTRRPSPQPRVVSSQAIDADIQEAIRLHEAGELEHSTRIFGKLADPNGANNPLSQVLYGLALR